MKKLLAGSIVAILLLLGSPAQAAPQFGYDWNRRHGWIVWADNDRPYTIRTTCRWTANGSRWTWRPYIRPYRTVWATSDEGAWGNRRPRNLRCSYVRA